MKIERQLYIGVFIVAIIIIVWIHFCETKPFLSPFNSEIVVYYNGKESAARLCELASAGFNTTPLVYEKNNALLQQYEHKIRSIREKYPEYVNDTVYIERISLANNVSSAVRVFKLPSYFADIAHLSIHYDINIEICQHSSTNLDINIRKVIKNYVEDINANNTYNFTTADDEKVVESAITYCAQKIIYPNKSDSYATLSNLVFPMIHRTWDEIIARAKLLSYDHLVS